MTNLLTLPTKSKYFLVYTFTIVWSIFIMAFKIFIYYTFYFLIINICYLYVYFMLLIVFYLFTGNKT